MGIGAGRSPVEPQFVFLIGAARSGTKFLRDLLSTSGAISCVPFDVNYVWRFGNENHADDVIAPSQASAQTAAFVRRTLANMARRNNGGAAPVVLEKTVSNVLRVPYVHALFPEARFVHLVRDGRDVALSAARQWGAPEDVGYLMQKLRYFPLRNFRYGLWFVRNALASRFSRRDVVRIWGPRYPGIEEDAERLPLLQVAARQWVHSVSTAHRDLQLIPKDQMFTIRYEQLVADPSTLGDLLAFLDVPDPDRVLNRHRAVADATLGGRWRDLPDAQRGPMLETLAPALTLMDYNESC